MDNFTIRDLWKTRNPVSRLSRAARTAKLLQECRRGPNSAEIILFPQWLKGPSKILALDRPSSHVSDRNKGMSEMRRNVLTLRAKVIGAAILPLALGVGSALAFTETPVQQSGQQAAPLAPAAPATTNQAPAAGQNGGASLSLTDPAAGTSKGEGTEVKIPGIGTVGTLPKLDFGLELLYGANGEGQTSEKPAPSNDDVLIRGTLKHRF